MSRITVAPIVEGHGEVEAVRILLERIWYELFAGEFIDVLKPIRQPRPKLAKEDGLRKAVALATGKLRQTGSADPMLVLVLLDADKDCPAELAPQLLTWARATDSTMDSICVIAKVEYETWFVAAAESLKAFLTLGPGDPPSDPESGGSAKGWIKKRFRQPTYSETRHQPRMTSAMDLTLCRGHSPSFDKLCRDLEMRVSSRRA